MIFTNRTVNWNVLSKNSGSSTCPYGGFHKWGYPKLVGLEWKIPLYKMDDLGVPRKFPYYTDMYSTWRKHSLVTASWANQDVFLFGAIGFSPKNGHKTEMS